MGRSRYHDDDATALTAREAFGKLTIDRLAPLVKLLTDAVPKRKPELVASLAEAMTDPARLRNLYDQLDPLARAAVQDATHDRHGRLVREKFEARHGGWPEFYRPHPDPKPLYPRYDSHTRPTPLALFFPARANLPTDVREVLLGFVPAPAAFALPTTAEPPATVRLTWTEWGKGGLTKRSDEVPVVVRETARDAAHDLRAVLRLVEAGRVRVSDKKRRPTAATRQAVGEVLQGGDFYAAADAATYDHEPDHDLAIKAFAWPILVQVAGLAEPSGDRLALTAAGRKALTAAAPDALRAAYRKWRTSPLLDEFNRIDVLKGQGNAGLSALAARRKAVLDALAACPAGAWFALDDFFRFLRATDRDFVLAHRVHELYIAEHYYGNLGSSSKHEWEQLQGRYVLAVLFEYAATLGLIDVAYAPPRNVRDDFHDRWGTDDYACLSRYDGLLAVRINPLGAWCLGLAETYQAPPPEADDVLRVLPNLEVVATRRPVAAADRLVLDRFAEPTGEGVWRLTAEKLMAVLEQGGTLAELEEFLAARSPADLPATVATFLRDQRQRAGRLRDRGTARLVECIDAALAEMLAADPQLRGKVERAGERGLIFQPADETAVRRALRKLGHVLPPQA